MLLATIAARFQEGLCVRIVANHIEGADGVVANKDNLTEKWDDQIENGNPLERLRAKQMKMLIAEGPIQSVVPEHVILVLERIIAYDKRHFEVRFLDGTVKQICISE